MKRLNWRHWPLALQISVMTTIIVITAVIAVMVIFEWRLGRPARRSVLLQSLAVAITAVIATSVGTFAISRLTVKNSSKQARTSSSLSEDDLSQLSQKLRVLAHSSDNTSARLDQTLASLREETEKRKQAEEALWENKERLHAVFESSIDGIIITDSSSKIVQLNNAAACMHRCSSKNGLIGRSLFDLVLDKDRKRIVERIRLISEQGDNGVIEYTCLACDGGRFPAELSAYPMSDESGRPVGLIAVIKGIGERKQVMERLREVEDLYSAIANSSQFGIYIVQDSKFAYVNSKFAKDTGYSADELLGASLTKLIHPDDRKIARENTTKMLAGEVSSPYEYRVINKNGETRIAIETVVPVTFEGKPAYLACYTDITERKQMEEAIKYLAYYDDVTGLPNQVLLKDRLKLELAHARRNRQKIGVMLLDLDHFKQVNDAFGHNTGDWLLQRVGQRLKNFLRNSDTVARTGGDEFVLLLPELNRVEDAFKVAEKVLKAMREPFVFDGQRLDITTSIGIAIYPDDGENGDVLIKNAETAMYLAKERGRNTYQRSNPTISKAGSQVA